MSEVERIVASLISANAPLTRPALSRLTREIAPEVAPLASEDDLVEAVDAIVGLGPLERLVGDGDVTDVLVNGPAEVWVEREGDLERVDIAFRSAEDVVAMVRRVISPLGLRIDRAQPDVDARLPDGSRLHAIIPPAAVDGPVLAIRRFHESIATLDDLLDRATIDGDQLATLTSAVASKRNILIAGSTGSGKTTLLNALCAVIPPGERIVTIEDAAELHPPGHVVRLEARSANVEGAGGISVRDLVRHALRLRPDRIVVGEVRGPEALDMIQALTTGHSGSMSTIHANGPDEAIARLETLAAMAPDNVPHAALHGLVTSAIDTIVVLGRRKGRRVVNSIEDLGERAG